MCGSEHTTFKSYMDYRAVTDVNSKQYKLIRSNDVVVGLDGLLYYGEYIGVALGSRYGSVGDRFVLTMDDGKKVKVIMLDVKSDKHTYDRCHHISDSSLVEFVVDVNRISEAYPTAALMGDLNYIPKLSGNVIKIQKVLN